MGAPLELTNGNGDTALSYAARDGHLEVVRTLLELGATTNGKSGKRARGEAKANGHDARSASSRTTSPCPPALASRTAAPPLLPSALAPRCSSAS